MSDHAQRDQNGTVHAYEFDPPGRQVCDRVTELGEGVDGAVRRIERTVEVRGLPDTITCFDEPVSGGVVNQVKMEYDSFGQLTSDYQEHAAVVSVETSPKVGYRYDRLHRLVDFDRGKLIRDDDLIDPLVWKMHWTLDATGNWSRFRRFDQHDAGAALDQTRGHNGANEVTGLSLCYVGVYCLCFLLTMTGFGCSDAATRRPSLVDDIEEGSLVADDIATIDFLRFEVRKGWPFSDKDYQRLESHSIESRETIRDFIHALRLSGRRAPPRPTHPISHYYGIVRVNVREGGHYYCVYVLLDISGAYFTSLRANTKDATNPNHATRYHNEPFAEFIRKHDPWYRLAHDKEE